MKKITILVMLLITSITLLSQNQNKIFNEITNEEGLNPWDIRVIFQDRKGFIWIGSNDGLQRYDGYEFKSYGLPAIFHSITEDSRGILWLGTNNGIYLLNPERDKIVRCLYDPALTIVFKIHEDNNGIIWCATQNGVLKIEPKVIDRGQLKELIFEEEIEAAFNISIFKLDQTDNIENTNVITCLYEDIQERLWVGGPMGLYIFNKETNEFIRIDDDLNGNSRLINQYVYTIAAENSDNIWVQTAKGNDSSAFTKISNIEQAFSNAVFDKSVLDFFNYSPDNLVPSTPAAFNFFIDSKNNIWIESYRNGLLKMIYNENNNVTLEEVYAGLYKSVSSTLPSVRSIMEDRTGLLWIGHEFDGILQFREENDLFTSKEGILEEYLSDEYGKDLPQTYEDDDGNLWISSWGNGIFRITADGKIDNYQLADSDFPGKQGLLIARFLEIEKGTFVVHSSDGLWKLNTNTGLSQVLLENGGYLPSRKIENFVPIIINQGLWIYNLTTNKIEQYINNQNDTLGLIFNNIGYFEVLQNDEIWIFSRHNGFNRLSLNKATGELRFLPLPEVVIKYNQIALEINISLSDMHIDKKGLLWLCTRTGLVKLDIESGVIQNWTEADGLTSNITMSIEEDNNGNMWIGTEYGLSMLDPTTGVIRTYNGDEGLPKVRHDERNSSKNDEGLIYFSGNGGIYCFNPDNILINNFIPPVVITEFKLFNKSVNVDSTKKAILTKDISYTQEIDLKYNQNDLSFTFAALDYNAPTKNKYAYMLDGYQNEWIETDASNRIATYTNLSPGEYIFRVKGSNNDGVWNEEGTFINITIHPPFWKTTLAYIVYGIFIFLLLRGYIFWRTQRLRKEKIVLEKKVNDRTVELKTANTKLREHEQELQEVNTLLEEQKEELMQQKEELQVTLENLQKTQEQLVESEKMAAVGGLVAGVAHEINTPVGIGITAISNLKDDIQRMSKLYEKDEISRDDFKKFLQSSQDVANLIEKNLERTASLVQSFKQVSTDQVTEQQRVFAFREYLEDILTSLRPKFSDKNIIINVECNEKLKLNSYPGVYAQIFTNLLLNSLQHGFYEKDKGAIIIKADMDKELLRIQYSDDGAGISKKDLPHIFEPFYTSDQHRGTGLGLNIIYNLVKQKLHGNIACESEQGKGVLFRIDVPVR